MPRGEAEAGGRFATVEEARRRVEEDARAFEERMERRVAKEAEAGDGGDRDQSKRTCAEIKCM